MATAQLERPWQDEETLKELYWEGKMSTAEIGDELGCSPNTIRYWFDEFNIQTRDMSTATSMGKLSKLPEELTDPNWLQEKYHEEGHTCQEVGNMVGYSRTAVQRALERHGIERRSSSECNRGSKNPNWLGDELEFECKYCGSVERKSHKDAPGMFCSRECMGKWRSENWVGEESPNWEGGHEKYYGPNWERQRTKALKRDGYECQRCGLDNESHKEINGRSLEVHHITPAREFEDYEKQNDLDNLITLCQSCHRKLEGVPIDTDT